MKIKWQGNHSFRIEDKKVKVSVFPEDKKDVKDIEFILTDKDLDFEVGKETKVINWPGEYEVFNAPIIGLKAWKKEIAENPDLTEEELTVIYKFAIEKVKFCHLSSIGQKLDKEMISKIGDVDILMIDLSDKSNLPLKKAMEAIESIDPRVLMPMGEGSIEAFLKEVGEEEIERHTVYTFKGSSDLPDDSRELVIFEK